jgi:hypothetical protein
MLQEYQCYLHTDLGANQNAFKHKTLALRQNPICPALLNSVFYQKLGVSSKAWSLISKA